MPEADDPGVLSAIEPKPASSDRAEVLEKLATGLHDLCQPLTALQWRLELGLTEACLADAVLTIREALADCERLNTRVSSMQIWINERQQGI